MSEMYETVQSGNSIVPIFYSSATMSRTTDVYNDAEPKLQNKYEWYAQSIYVRLHSFKASFHTYIQCK